MIENTKNSKVNTDFKANQLFKTADSAQKQMLLKGLAYNVEMFDRKLSYKLVNCYQAFKELNETTENELNDAKWYTVSHALISSAREYEDSIQLRELVSTFKLSGSLLAV